MSSTTSADRRGGVAASTAAVPDPAGPSNPAHRRRRHGRCSARMASIAAAAADAAAVAREMSGLATADCAALQGGGSPWQLAEYVSVDIRD